MLFLLSNLSTFTAICGSPRLHNWHLDWSSLCGHIALLSARLFFPQPTQFDYTITVQNLDNTLWSIFYHTLKSTCDIQEFQLRFPRIRRLRFQTHRNAKWNEDFLCEFNWIEKRNNLHTLQSSCEDSIIARGWQEKAKPLVKSLIESLVWMFAQWWEM